MRTLISAILVATTLALAPTSPAVANDPFFVLDGYNRYFFPTVEDGYKDFASVTYTFQEDAVAETWTVTDRRGAVIHQETAPTYFRGATFTWDGKDARGHVMSPGEYEIHLAVDQDPIGQPEGSDLHHETSVTVEIMRSKSVVTRRGAWIPGEPGSKHWGRVKTTGGCEATKLYRSAFLDCYGGRGVARASYSFYIPVTRPDAPGESTARKVRLWVQGAVHCCPRGKVTKKVERTKKNTYRISVTVSGRRSYSIEAVRYSYVITRTR